MHVKGQTLDKCIHSITYKESNPCEFGPCLLVRISAFKLVYSFEGIYGLHSILRILTHAKPSRCMLVAKGRLGINLFNRPNGLWYISYLMDVMDSSIYPI